MNCLVYLVEGAAMSPVSRILATHMGCSVGIGKMCFTKKVFSSTTCHISMNWLMATIRILKKNKAIFFHEILKR